MMGKNDAGRRITLFLPGPTRDENGSTVSSDSDFVCVCVCVCVCSDLRRDKEWDDDSEDVSRKRDLFFFLSAS